MANERPPSAGTQSKVASQGSEGPDGPYSQPPLTAPKARSRGRDRPDSTPQRLQKKHRSFSDGQENDSNATNMAQQAARPLQAEKRRVAAFTSALARDQDGPVISHQADQGFLKKPTMAPTREKYSGLRVRVPSPQCSYFPCTLVTPTQAVMSGSLAICLSHHRHDTTSNISLPASFLCCTAGSILHITSTVMHCSHQILCLQMKNPVFPSVVLQERMSMLQFLRLSRAG